ncbi:DNA glycosylase [Chloropicon primus]|nr:DNA glycosylase [Chloropicon primus]
MNRGVFEKYAFVGAGKGYAQRKRGENENENENEKGKGKGSCSAKRRRREEGGGLEAKLGKKPLRLILVGHNPSQHAWASGHYYSNPSNRMWKILRETGIAPEELVRGCEDDGSMQESCGVGFIDVGVGMPGTDSSQFTTKDMATASKNFYAHLSTHLERASESIGCLCGKCGSPKLVAFTGKKQFVELVNADRLRLNMKKVQTVPLGPQDSRLLPQDWPFGRTDADTRVWVLTSTSGASALTNSARIAPYADLSAELAKIPWPLPKDEVLRCHQAPPEKESPPTTTTSL